ncbi:MAG: hypothetical protein K0S23_1867 [Fluviicola sp.]|jgi:hypothetical protein|uniref:hypothetical protein n=1 Tax=Fluviicola sp. TaxID=1917219 RepID=UPI0026183BCF|nr:hypothetical protein [Fluviicola sp.]MDF3027560.1 hypothetical protein [Fluviicola sp.]
MKQFVVFFILTFLIACSSQETSKTNSLEISESPKEHRIPGNSGKKEIKSEGEITLAEYQTSTYDDPEFADEVKKHQEDLKKLSDKNVFAVIHTKLIQKLAKKHQEYFKTKSNYEILAVANGNLFQENKNDSGFIVYDQKNQRVSILVYREAKNAYSELFRELKVENGLEHADCNYTSFGTIDYQLAGEIIYQEESLIKNPESYTEYPPVRITDLAKDGDFILKEGCFSKKISQKKTANSLCIATSSVYNNWEALKYDKRNNTFIIFYGQAFAD